MNTFELRVTLARQTMKLGDGESGLGSGGIVPRGDKVKLGKHPFVQNPDNDNRAIPFAPEKHHVRNVLEPQIRQAVRAPQVRSSGPGDCYVRSRPGRVNTVR